MLKLYNDKIDIVQDQLNNHIVLLTNNFILKHKLNPVSTPDDFDLDVKAYCVLCHAALEEFIETIALIVMDYSIHNFVYNKKVNKSLLTLMHFKSNIDINFINDKEGIDSIITVSDYIRERTVEIKKNFSGELFNNHGVSLKYLKKTLLPVAIDIPKEVDLLNSLSIITGERGNYAHKYTERGSVRRSISPEIAEGHIINCLVLSDLLGNNAKNL